MKLHIVFNKDGEILGAAQVDPGARIKARPIADEKEGHKAAEVYVPVEYRHYDLAGICQKLKVDVKAKLPDLKAKE